ncbi:MAG: PAS domain S-box protein [Rhodocyclales bacterium]|nr:PAS domain S-box protein [Rhodocyclales bacterium]
MAEEYVRFLLFRIRFGEAELAIKYKVVFLNSVFLFAGVAAFGVAFMRFPDTPLLAASDFVYAGLNWALLLYLNANKDKVEVVSSLALLLTFLVMLAVYLLAPANPTRISLFFLLSASAFFLKGRRAGQMWTAAIVAAIVVGHFAAAGGLGYSGFDIFLTCVYLVALLLIFESYEALKDDQHRRIEEQEVRRASEERTRRLGEALQQTWQAIVIADTGLRFEYVNPAFTRLFGYAVEELVGKSINLLAVDETLQVNPEQAAAIAASKGAFGGEVLRRAKDGRHIPVLVNIAPIRDAQGRIINYVGTMADLTEFRQMQESLRESEEKFRSMSAAAYDAVIMLDENGVISFWNAAAEKIFGYAASEMCGRDLHQALAPQRYQAAYQAGFATFRETGCGAAVGKTLELEAIRKGGEEFPMEISLSAVRHKDRWLALGIVRDISERKRAEREVRAYLDEVTRANAELKALNSKLEQAQGQLLQSEKMASIGLLAAGVAHEINNPIGFVNSNLGTLGSYVGDFLRLINAYEKAEELLRDREDAFAGVGAVKRDVDIAYEKEDVVSLMAESSQGIERVKKIIQNLKDFSRIDSEEKWSPEDIHRGLESTLTVVWNELKYTCEVRKEYGALPLVECLLSQLNQVFMNLLVNAAQAIEKKGVITIRTGVQNDSVWIEIADTGKGIAPENMKRLFDPFFTTKPVGKGTGLGLSVSYSIVEKHHGTIEVESVPGQGTTFRVRLPISQPR